MRDYQEEFTLKRQKEHQNEERNHYQDLAFAELGKYQKEQKIEERARFLYNTKIDLENNFPNAFAFFVNYAHHNNQILLENRELTEQFLQNTIDEEENLLEDLTNKSFNLAKTEKIRVLPVEEEMLCYDKEVDGLTYAETPVAIIENGTISKHLKMPIFISDITGKNSRLLRLKAHYEKTLESAKLVLADCILEYQTYEKTTKLLDKMLHPVTHQSNLRFLEGKIATANSTVSLIQKELNEVEQTINHIYASKRINALDNTIETLNLGNTYFSMVEKRETLEARLAEYEKPETIAVPFDVYLERPEVGIENAANTLHKLVKFIKSSNISTRFNDGTKGFPVQDYVDFGSFEPELLEFLRFIEANPTFSETLTNTSESTDDNNK